MDDDFATRLMFLRLLRLEGFRTFAAQDGEEALVCARRQKPDLVLLDYDPSGRNGLDILADLKTVHDSLRFMLVTGSDEAGLEARARGAGARFFAKPFDVESLLAEIRKVLG